MSTRHATSTCSSSVAEPMSAGGWQEWEWDETLFAGAAPYYAQGRLPYAEGLANRCVLRSHSTAADGCSTSVAVPVWSRSNSPISSTRSWGSRG